MKTPLRYSLFSLALLWAALAQAASPARDAALVTALDGTVNRITAIGREPLQAFVKLKQGDQLALDGNARIQIVFFESRRQEIWRGGGRLEITAQAGKGTDLPEPQVKSLPEILVKQIARTPALDSQGRAGVVRLRTISTTGVVEKLNNDYKKLRDEATGDDLNPELFLLAGLLEMRQLERIEQVLADLQTAHPGNTEAKALVTHYQKALKDLRENSR